MEELGMRQKKRILLPGERANGVYVFEFDPSVSNETLTCFPPH
jgi:hypothetical protein